MDARRSVADERGLVHRTGVALVRVERPVGVVDGVLAHLTIAGDLGEDARRRHTQTSQVGLDGELDVGDRRRDEVPRAVRDGNVGNDVEPLDRPARGEFLGRGHAELITLLLARRPDRPRHTPVGDSSEQRFAFTFGQQLRVAHSVHAGVPGQHGGADHQWARPRPAADLVDPDHQVVAAFPHRLLERPCRRVLLRHHDGALGDRHHRTTSTGSPSASSPTRHHPSVVIRSSATLGSTAARRPPEVCGSKHSASPPGVARESRWPAR